MRSWLGTLPRSSIWIPGILQRDGLQEPALARFFECSVWLKPGYGWGCSSLFFPC